MASCLSWPSTQDGHLSSVTFFYANLLIAFVAIVSRSQQLLVVPNGRGADADICDGASLAIKLEDG